MLKVLFLLLFLMNFAAFAQTQEKPKQDNLHKAYKSAEFGRITNGHIEALFDGFLAELANDKTAQGYIINYGSNREVVRRERHIRNQINFREIDAQRITFIQGGILNEIKTEFWIVSENAEPPKLIPALQKFDEFGLIHNGEIKIRSEKFLQKLIAENSSQGYIITYGTNRAIAARERQLRNSSSWRCGYDCARITFVKGGDSKQLKTIFWLVPEGAEPPKP
jgi:hypothetical protein